jgi:hypothetical protein
VEEAVCRQVQEEEAVCQRVREGWGTVLRKTVMLRAGDSVGQTLAAVSWGAEEPAWEELETVCSDTRSCLEGETEGAASQYPWVTSCDSDCQEIDSSRQEATSSESPQTSF